MQGGHLLLIDSLSTGLEQIVSDDSGYIAKYRAVGDYLALITRRGFHLQEEFLIKEVVEKKLVNKLFLFEFDALHPAKAPLPHR